MTKYRNKPCMFQGQRFDSILEKERYIVLLDFQKRGLISQLERQVNVKLTAYGHHICDFRPDFRYRKHTRDGERVVYEDAKGILTDVARIKLKLFTAMTDYPVVLIRKANLHDLP